MVSLPANRKCCGTCEFWAGTRKPVPNAKQVQYDSGTKGQCLGPWKSSQKGGIEYCPSWKKWGLTA